MIFTDPPKAFFQDLNCQEYHEFLNQVYLQEKVDLYPLQKKERLNNSYQQEKELKIQKNSTFLGFIFDFSSSQIIDHSIITTE